MMIQVMQVVAADARTCPCCGESHAVQECVVQRRIVGPGMVAQVPARYFYCANTDEYFEDCEMHEWNMAQGGGFGFAGAPPFAAGPMPNAPMPDELERAMRDAAEAAQNEGGGGPREDEGK